MSVKSIPEFSIAAEKLWEAIPSDSKQRLLSKVWCGRCSRSVTITNFTGVVKAGDLLLVGKCAECHGDVARLIETN